MKSPSSIVRALVLAVGLVACNADQLLDVTSPTQVSDDNFWTQESDAQFFLTGTYSTLPGINYVVELDGITDNGTINKQFDDRYRYAEGSYDAQANYSRNLWIQFFAGVARTNILLANIGRIPAGQIDATRKNRYIAEAKFLRGVFYLNLVALFGNVPMPLTPQTDAEARALANTASTLVYDQIIKDFDEAAAVLPLSYTGTDVGRATKGAALAFKARAALYSGRNQLAADAAKAVMDLAIYDLFPTYGTLFTYAGEGSKEAVFVRTYSKTAQAPGTNNQVFQNFGPISNGAVGDVIPTRTMFDFYQMTDGQPIATSPLYKPAPYPNAAGTMNDNRDPRLAATILYPGATYDGRTYDSRPKPISTQPEGMASSDFNLSTTGYNLRKYIDVIDKADRSNGGIDAMLMRYADVLLMYAEAKLALGQADAPALAALNKVRTRAGMPALAALTAADLRYERRVELAFEGLRLFDLRRWRIADQVMPTTSVKGIDYINASGALVTVAVPVSARTFPARNYLWPFPQSEIDLNKNLVQPAGF